MNNLRVVVLEHALLDSLANNHVYREFAACLDMVRTATPVGPGCRRCGRASGKDAAVYNAAKLCLIGLPQEARDRLKALLGASALRLVVAHGGQTQTYSI